MNVTVDLMQLRWQLIRTMEYAQHVEIDNVNLRKRIIELEKPKGNLLQTSVKAMIDLDNQVKILKNQRSELKAVVSLEIQENARFQNRIRQMLEKFAFIWGAKEIDWMKIAEENNHLKISLADVREKLAAANQLRIREGDRMKIKFDEMKQDMLQLEQSKLTMSLEYGEMKAKYDEIVKTHSNMGVNIEATNAEVKRLKALVQDYEGKYRKLSIESKEHEQQIIDYYEHLLMQMYGENQELNMVINELKEQVQRLATAMLGNKSHFAKFVELKAENLDLQTKLKKISKKMSGDGSALGVPTPNGSKSTTGSAGNKPDHLLLYQQRIFNEHQSFVSESENQAHSLLPLNKSDAGHNGVAEEVSINGRVRSYRPSHLNFSSAVSAKDSNIVAQFAIPVMKEGAVGIDAEEIASNIVSKALKGKSLRYVPPQQRGGGGIPSSPRSLQNSPRIIPSSDFTYQTDFQIPLDDDLDESGIKDVVITGVKAMTSNIAQVAGKVPSLSVGPIQLGVPLLSKQLRESLKDRVIV